MLQNKFKREQRVFIEPFKVYGTVHAVATIGPQRYSYNVHYLADGRLQSKYFKEEELRG